MDKQIQRSCDRLQRFRVHLKHKHTNMKRQTEEFQRGGGGRNIQNKVSRTSLRLSINRKHSQDRSEGNAYPRYCY